MFSLDLDELPIALVRLDRDGLIVGATPAFLEWAQTDDVVGRRFSDIATHATEDLFAPSDGPGPWMMQHRDHPERAALVSRAELDDGALLTVVEASDRFAALVELRRSYALADRTRSRLSLVIDAAIALADAEDEAALAGLLAESVKRAYGAEQSVVFFIDETGGFHLAAGENPFSGMLSTPSVAQLALGLRDVVLVSGEDEAYRLSPMVAQAMADVGVRALLAAPIAHEDGKPYGLVGCFFRHPRDFDEEAGPLADALSSQAAQALAKLRLQRRLAHAAMHDETTGLPNRRMLEEQLAGLGAAWATSLAVIFLDLDGFKGVNDRHGHPVGDEVLRETGRRLLAGVREGDIVARYGGDEFVVVCEVADADLAAEIAERLRDSIEQPFEVAGDTVQIAASVGVSLAASHGSRLSTDQLVRAADQAMYLAKSGGGNRVVHDPGSLSLA